MRLGFEVESAKAIDYDAPASASMRASGQDRIRRNPSTDQKKVRRQQGRKTANMDPFWEMIDQQIEALKSAKSADDVLRILPGGSGVGDGFFEGSGGDETVYDSLSQAGWTDVAYEAPYYWAMKAPNGDVISYVEGDIYRGNQLVKDSVAHSSAAYRRVISVADELSDSLWVEASEARDGVSQELWDAAGKDAGLGVGHIWTNVRCPAYRSLDPADCACDNRKSASRKTASSDLKELAKLYWGGYGSEDTGTGGFVSADGFAYRWEGPTTLVSADGAWIEFRQAGDGWEFKDSSDEWQPLAPDSMEDQRAAAEAYYNRPITQADRDRWAMD